MAEMLSKPGTFSSWSLLSLLILPVGWQLIDFNMWQRLGAVKLSKTDTGDLNDKPIRIGLRRFAIESPITIMLAVLLGVSLHFGTRQYDDVSIWGFLELLSTDMTLSGTLGSIVAALFSVAILGIMLSTADSALVAAVSAFTYDGWPKTRRILDADGDTRELDKDNVSRVVRFGVVTACCFILLGLTAHFVASVTTKSKVDLASLLFASLGIQLALAPLVLGAIFLDKLRPKGLGATLSAIAGFLGGFSSMVYSFWDGNWAFMPPAIAVASSSVVYIIVVLWRLTWRERKHE